MYFSNKQKILDFLYNIGINLVAFGLKFLALFNAKIKLGVQGRAHTFQILRRYLDGTAKTLWFHCASLGEYEQGLPILEQLKLNLNKK